MPTARPRGDCAQGYICLLCTFETPHRPCPMCSVRIGSKGYRGCTYVFPTKGGAAFAAIDISDGVVACRHWAVIRFAFNDIYTGYDK